MSHAVTMCQCERMGAIVRAMVVWTLCLIAMLRGVGLHLQSGGRRTIVQPWFLGCSRPGGCDESSFHCDRRQCTADLYDARWRARIAFYSTEESGFGRHH